MRVADVAVRDLDAWFLARWGALAAAAAEPNAFFEPSMAVAAARHLAGGAGDRVLAVSGDDDRLLAVLPFRRRGAYRRVPVPALQAWGHDHAFLDAPLVDAQAPEEALGAAVDHLREHRREAWLVLPTLPADGPVHAALTAVLSARRMRPVAVLPFARPVIHRRPEPTYLDGRFSSRRRKELRKQRRRLGDTLGGEPATVELLCAGTGVDEAVDELLRLEASGWKGRAGTALASRESDAAFFRDAMRAFAEDGRARVWALRGGDATAAMACGVVSGNTLFHLKIAHDEALARASPGLLLELDLIDAFHAESSLAHLDSCTGAAATDSPSERLYPDRRPMRTLLVPLHPVRGAAAVIAVRGALGARASAERLRQREER